MADSPLPRLRRTLLGLSRAVVDRRLQQQQQEYAQKVAALEQEMADACKERAELLTQVSELQERLKASYHTNDVLREKLYNERATNAVLVARVMQQQQAIDDTVKADMAARSEPKFKKVRVAAEVQREHEALQELIEVLYQTITRRGGGAVVAASRLAPAARPASRFVRKGPGSATEPGQEPDREGQAGQAGPANTAELATAQAAAAAQTSGQTAPPVATATAPAAGAGNMARRSEGGDETGTRWHQFVVGKLVGRDIKTRDGKVFARDGDPITVELVQSAQEADVLLDLVVNMRLPFSEAEL